MNFIDRAYSELDSLRVGLGLLPEAMHIGTPRRWIERDLSQAQLDRQGQEHKADRIERIENAAKGIKPAGNSKAPLRLEVLDALVDIEESVKELEAAVCDRLGLTPLESADTEERINRLIKLLNRIDEDEDLAKHFMRESARLNRTARSAIGDSEPVYKIKARCIICDSLSLRAFTERNIVMCVNSYCRCDDEECPCHNDRPAKHSWPYELWESLSKALDARKAS